MNKAKSPPPQINLSAGINTTGYGVVASNILKELRRQGVQTTLFPIGQPQIENPEVEDAFKAGISNYKNTNSNAPGLRIWHQFDMAPRYSRGLSAGLTFFELDALSELEVAHLQFLDIIFVGSEWAQGVVMDAIPKANCHILPIGVDTEIFRPREPQPSSPYKFFTIGKWEVRKGHDILNQIIHQAFGPNDDVEFYFKCHNPLITERENQDWINYFSQGHLKKKVHFVKTQNHQEVANLINSCHCGIFPTRAEGFGLGILESIACNKPVITTDYSAPKDFCFSSNSRLIPIQDMEPAYDGRWFHGDRQWAHLSDKYINDFAAQMRFNFDNKIVDNPGYETVIQTFSWKNCVNKILEHLMPAS